MTRYISLGEYLWLAEQVTGVDTETLLGRSAVGLADSALHAPAATFGEQEFYPSLAAKAAVLVCRLCWNHPLVDGNKRAAWAALRLFVDLNGGRWDPDPPNIDDAEQTMFAIAAGEVDESWVSDWLVSKLTFE